MNLSRNFPKSVDRYLMFQKCLCKVSSPLRFCGVFSEPAALWLKLFKVVSENLVCDEL